jgi:hypothetical protein
MKKMMLALSVLFVVGNTHADGIKPHELYTITLTYSTLAPFVVTANASKVSTQALHGQNRGVAAREQIKDDLVAFNDDVINLGVKTIDEVRQPALKELFMEIAANEDDMEKLKTLLPEGTELQKIAATVVYSLFAE